MAMRLRSPEEIRAYLEKRELDAIRKAEGPGGRLHDAMREAIHLIGMQDAADMLQKAVQAPSVQLLAQRYVAQNWGRSGMDKPHSERGRTGALRYACQNAHLEAKIWRGKLVLRVVLPTAMPDYPGDRPFHLVANALNWGALRQVRTMRRWKDRVTGAERSEMGPPFGSKARKTIKKYLRGDELSSREEAWKKKRKIENSVYNQATGTSEANVDGHRVVMIKPFMFFTLTKDQKAKIIAGIGNIYWGWIDSIMRGEAAG